MGKDAIRDGGRDVRMTVADAAEHLNITKEAVRKRISRRTLRSDKDPDGTVWVYIPPSSTVSGTVSGTASGSIDRGELVELLRAQLEDLRVDRDAWRDQARRSDYMASAAMDRTRELESRIRELEAPTEEARESSPQTVEEEPEREVEPRSAAAREQEGTEPPRQRSVWREPVDKLPWWQYLLGLLLISLASYLARWLAEMMLGLGVPAVVREVTRLVLAWGPPGVFGFWVGFRRRNPRLRSQIIPFGILVGLAVAIGGLGREFGEIPRATASVAFQLGYATGFTVSTFLAGWLFYVSGALIGSAWQRRHTERISGTTPPSPMPGANLASPGSRAGWTPRQQAILGFAGTVIAALISLMGTIISVRAGGP